MNKIKKRLKTKSNIKPETKSKEKLKVKLKKSLPYVFLSILILIICIIIFSNKTINEVDIYNDVSIYTDIDIYEALPTFNEIETEESTENTLDDVDEKEEDDEEEIKSETTSSKNKYYIKVNYNAQVVTIYTTDSDGDYTVPVKAMICSTGTYTPTSGTYNTTEKYRWRTLFGDVYGQYATRIVDSILFHSVPYFDYNDNSSLEYLEYDKLGTAASAGCVRLTVEDAKWIYDNCVIGTSVEFYSSSDPGPLGKPTSQKISSYPDYLRNFDPTDPSSNNPWLTYEEEKEYEEKVEEDTESTTDTNSQNTDTEVDIDINTDINIYDE